MLDDLKNKLESKGIIPSYHRIKIYEYLINNKSHPTADIIYSDMIDQIPTLSKTTIYNTLKTFIKKGIISSITIEDNEVRYDPETNFHGHYKCVQCGGLYDIEFDKAFLNSMTEFVAQNLKGYGLMESHLYFKGVCKNCLS